MKMERSSEWFSVLYGIPYSVFYYDAFPHHVHVEAVRIEQNERNKMKMAVIITVSDIELLGKAMAAEGCSALVLEGEDGGLFSDRAVRIPLSKWLWDFLEHKQALGDPLPKTRADADKGRWI